MAWGETAGILSPPSQSGDGISSALVEKQCVCVDFGVCVRVVIVFRGAHPHELTGYQGSVSTHHLHRVHPPNTDAVSDFRDVILSVCPQISNRFPWSGFRVSLSCVSRITSLRFLISLPTFYQGGSQLQSVVY